MKKNEVTQEQFSAPILQGFFKKKVIGIELTDECDLNCICCFTDRGRKSKADMIDLGLEPVLLSIDELDKLIKDAKEAGYESVLCPGQGEPTINRKRFWKFIDIINKYNMTPIIITNGYWVTFDDAQRLFDSNVTILAKLWTLDQDKNQKMVRDSLNRNYIEYSNIQIPEGLGNLLKIYTSDDAINKKGYKLALNCVINKLNKDEILDIIEWVRNQRAIPYFEFIFSSGNAERDPEFWLDGQGGSSMFDENWEVIPGNVEMTEREKIWNAIIEKDKELGFTYKVYPKMRNKAGQHIFDSLLEKEVKPRRILINPYGYCVGCVAFDHVLKDHKGKVLNVRTDFSEIVEIKNNVIPMPEGVCTIGLYTCVADQQHRKKNFLKQKGSL